MTARKDGVRRALEGGDRGDRMRPAARNRTRTSRRAHLSGPHGGHNLWALNSSGSTINGSLAYTGSATTDVCSSVVHGNVDIENLSGAGLIGFGEVDTGTCQGNRIDGGVTIANVQGFGVELDSNSISGAVSFTSTTTLINEIENNTIAGSLSCTGVAVAPVNDGETNTVTGPKTDQCAGL